MYTHVELCELRLPEKVSFETESVVVIVNANVNAIKITLCLVCTLF